MTEYSFHKFGSIFPLLEGAAFEALVANIKTHGLHEPIILLDDKILDGRNRYRACQEAQVKPRFQQFKGDDPLAYAIGKNLVRRHLNESQRAMIAARLATFKRGRPKLNPSIEGLKTETAAKLFSISATRRLNALRPS